MKATPLVSIVITSYNYEQFLNQTIDSALNQTYPNIEVVVVDDESKDSSREIIKSYGDRVVPVFKQNGGQGSACNAGFEAATGEILIFLDSDDLLLPDVAERVVEAFQTHADVAKVQYRLELMDVEGNLLGRTSPLERRRMPTGDLRPRIFRFPNYVWPPTSGNAFSVEALRRIMPIPEVTYRLSPDIYLNNLIPLCGAIVSLEKPGALYRKHEKNNGVTTGTTRKSIDLASFRENLVNTAELHKMRKKLIGDNSSKIGDRDSKFLIGRMISKKVDPQNHPFDDNLLSIFLDGVVTCSTEPGTYAYQKVFNVFWFSAMLVSSKESALQLANSLIDPTYRHPLLTELIKFIRKTQNVK